MSFASELSGTDFIWNLARYGEGLVKNRHPEFAAYPPPQHRHRGLHSKLHVCGSRGRDRVVWSSGCELRSITLSWRRFPSNQALDAKFGSGRITECRCTDEPQVHPNRVPSY